MSGYSAIGGDMDTRSEAGSQEPRHSSHPYMSGYGNAAGQRPPDSEAIEVSPGGSGGGGPSHSPYGYGAEPTAGPSTFNAHDGGQRISRYETSLSLRYDVEAALAYALGVFSGAILLVLEKKNDYVRFHAWQSALLSAAAFVVLVVTALISDTLYWLALLATVVVLGYSARRAYLDGAVFERFTLPYVGPLAMQLVDEE